MATVVDFRVDTSDVEKLLSVAERAEKVEKRRAESVKKSKKATLSAEDAEIRALQKNYKERQKNIKKLETLRKRREREELAHQKRLKAAEASRAKASGRGGFGRGLRGFGGMTSSLGGLTGMGGVSGLGGGIPKLGGVLTGVTAGVAGLVAGLGAIAVGVAKVGYDSFKSEQALRGLIDMRAGDGAADSLDKLVSALNMDKAFASETFLKGLDMDLQSKDAAQFAVLMNDILTKTNGSKEAVDAMMGRFSKGLSDGKAFDEVFRDVQAQAGLAADSLGRFHLENQKGWDKFTTRFGRGWDRMWVNIGRDVDKGLDYVGDLFNFWSDVEMSEVWESFSWGFGKAWQGIKDAASSAVDFFSELWGEVSDVALGWGKDAFKWGSDTVSGFVDGIKKSVGKAVDAAKGLGSSAWSALKGALGIKSPSKAFEASGLDSGAGYVKGLSKTLRSVEGMSTRLGETSVRRASKGAQVEARETSYRVAGGLGGSSFSPTINVTVNAAGGASGDDLGGVIAEAVRRELDRYASAQRIMQGGV